MIDFEALATGRSVDLSQPSEDWLQVVGQPAFQDACSTLSDGEILQLFSISETPQALTALAEGLAAASQSGETMAFDKWKNAFAANNIGLPQAARLWAKAWPTKKDFSECLSIIAAPNEISQRKRG